MVAIGCIAAAAHSNPSYSPGDANMHSHVIRGSLRGPTRVIPPNGISIGSAVLEGSRLYQTQTVRPQRSAYDMHAMRPKNQRGQ